MQESISPLNWSQVFRPLGEGMSQQLAAALAGLRLDAAAQDRYEHLAAENTAGTLTAAGQVELQEFVTLNRMVSILKAEAALSLQAGTKAA